MDDAPSTPRAASAPAATNLDLYVRALWPDRHRCLGRRLVPLTLGHVMLLRRLGSPLAGGQAPDTADLALAVFVCSRPWRRALAAMQRPWLGIRLLPLGLRARWAAGAAVRSLTAYLRRAMAGPRWWPVKEKGTRTIEIRSPYWLTIQAALEADLGMTTDAALDTPVAVALWKIASLREREGHIQLVSDDEMAALARSPEPFGEMPASKPVNEHARN